MYFSSSNVLGAGVSAQLAERIKFPLLNIGSDHFSRRDFAKVDCFNFLAAQNLSTQLNKVLKVKNTREVFFDINPGELAIPHLGAYSLAVLGAAFEIKGLGGDAPLEAWMAQHKLHIVTFHTMKVNELAEGSKERKALKQRKSERRDKAHGLRLARHESRQAKAS